MRQRVAEVKEEELGLCPVPVPFMRRYAVLYCFCCKKFADHRKKLKVANRIILSITKKRRIVFSYY